MKNSEESVGCLWGLIVLIVAIVFFVLVAKYCRFKPVAEMPGICL